MSATSAFECDGQGPACYFREDGSRCWPTADELLLRPSAARAADIAALGVESSAVNFGANDGINDPTFPFVLDGFKVWSRARERESDDETRARRRARERESDDEKRASLSRARFSRSSRSRAPSATCPC